MTTLQTSPYRTWPGLALCSAIVMAGLGLTLLPLLSVFSMAVWAVIVSAFISNTVGLPQLFRPGVSFASRTALRLGIVLLGLQVPLADIIALGWQSVLGIIGVALATFWITKVLAVPLGVDRSLAELLAGGTAICGASAIVAINTSTRAPENDVAYALGCITILGTVAMVTIPQVAGLLRMEVDLFSLWAGAAIHEVGQVAGAGLQYGNDSTELAMIAKLTRVLMLAPMILMIGLFALRGSRNLAAVPSARVPLVPVFVVGFFVCVALANTLTLPEALTASARFASSALFAVALAGLGFSIRLRDLRAKGARPFLLASISAILIAGGSLAVLTVIAAPGGA